MSASERLRELRGERIIPIFRKTGTKMLGDEAFTRDRDTERVMDALPLIADVVDAAEQASNELHGIPGKTQMMLAHPELAAAVDALRDALERE